MQRNSSSIGIYVEPVAVIRIGKIGKVIYKDYASRFMFIHELSPRLRALLK